MVGVFSWNDLDLLFALYFDLDLILILQHYAIDGYHFVLRIEPLLIEPLLIEPLLVERLQLNLGSGRSI